MHLDEHFITRAIPGVSLQYVQIPSTATFSIDSRTIKQDEIFVALEGEHHDGHDFIEQACAKGACAIMIEKSKHHYLDRIAKDLLKNKTIISVLNVRTALMQLASAWRAQFNYPVVGITGSVGKTSTKAILSSILTLNGSNYLVSTGNQNTFLGLSLNILKMRADHEVAIFEIGIDRCNEMNEKAALLQPTTALITNIGHAHMEGIGSITDIATQKRAIFSLFKEDNIGIINGDHALLSTISYSHPIVKFGLKTTNQVQARKINVVNGLIHFNLKLYGTKYKIILPTNHLGAVHNVLGAATMAYLLKVPADIIVQAIQQPISVEGRFERRPIKSGKGYIIHDSYNANPESMKSALLALQGIETTAQKIAVIGDMFELGVDSGYWHRQIGRFIMSKVPTLRQVILVGSMVEQVRKALPVNVLVDVVPTWQEAILVLEKKLDKDSVVLVKGSRGMQLQHLVNALAPLENR